MPDTPTIKDALDIISKLTVTEQESLMGKCVLRNLLISGLVGVCVISGGCGNSINYDIPNDAIAITYTDDNIYSNLNDSNDTYCYVEIDGVKYILYGTQGTAVTGKEIGSCIAYNKADSNERFYEVRGNNDFIASFYVNGEMEQFNFWRSVDTINANIDIPDFIDGLGYKIWN